MNLRMQQLRKTLNLSQAAFGDILGVSRSAVSNMESGRYNITDTLIKLACQSFSVNESWFYTGEDPMFVEQSDDPAKALCTKYNLPPSALSILNVFLSMDEKSRLTILDFTHRLAADLLENDYESLRPYLVTGEPVEGLHAARGGGVKPLELDDRAGTELDKIPESKNDI